MVAYEIVRRTGGGARVALLVKREHAEFIQQFIEYPNVSHEDVLEAVAAAVEELETAAGDDWDAIMAEEDDIPALVYTGGPP